MPIKCFQTAVLEKTLKSPLDNKELKPDLMQRADSLGKTLTLGKIEGRRRG